MKTLKNWLPKLIAATAVLLLAVLPVSAAGSAVTTTGSVKVDTSLRVRSAGNTGAPIVGRFYSGTKVTILSSYNGWYKINGNGLSGWVSSAYVKSISTSGITSAAASTAVNAAENVIGAPYLYGGATSVGFDCSGLLKYAYQKAGITLPHSSSTQAQQGTWVARSALRPGDLVFFNTSGGSTINHDGLYIGNGLFIAANSSGVQICDLDGSYWSNAYITARRISG